MRISCIIFSVFLPNSVFASCLERLTHGYRLDNFTTEIISNIGVHTCIKECLLRKPHCQSINYNIQHFLCGLNSREDEDIELEGVPDYNSIFANVVTDSLQSLGKCKEVVCQPLHKCVTTRFTEVCISTACSKGTYGKDGQCLPCPVGQYNDGSKQWCSYCPPGRYNNKTLSSSCRRCPKGTYNTLHGQTTLDSCVPCSPGTYQSKSGQRKCLNCPWNSYQDQKGQASCKLCSNLSQCVNEDRTECHTLPQHVKRMGYDGYNEGDKNKPQCKKACREKLDCVGFTVSPDDNSTCYTHTQFRLTQSKSTNFYEFPSGCHP
nr:signal peptide, CUB and EGF-like domain-containing protein 1 [Crassostrea gigas]